MSTFQQYNVSPWLSPARLVATTNQTGTYSNGTLNNGVGATFTYAPAVLTIDSVVVNLGDRILLKGQTAALQNGVYICTQAGTVGASAILTRSNDLQCNEQLRTGFYISIGAGTSNGGAAYVLIEPLPAHLGVDPMLWVSRVGG